MAKSHFRLRCPSCGTLAQPERFGFAQSGELAELPEHVLALGEFVSGGHGRCRWDWHPVPRYMLLALRAATQASLERIDRLVAETPES